MDLERRGFVIGRLAPRILAALTVALACGALMAQQDGPGRDRRPRERGPGGSGLASLMRPAYLGRDLAIFDEHLQFDESQRWIVETNLFDYETTFQEKLEVVRDQLRSARGDGGAPQPAAVAERRRREAEMRQLRRDIDELRNGDPRESQEKVKELTLRLERMRAEEPPRPAAPGPGQVEAWTEVIGTWIPEREALGAAFVESVRAILSKDQLERWPAAERALRRQKLLSLGQLSGESVNLFFLVRELPGSAGGQEGIDATLEEYAIAIDAALVAREALVSANQAAQLSAMLGQDAERAAALAQQEAALRLAVRSVNDQYLEALAGGLAGPAPVAAAELRQRYREAAFPRIYRPARAQAAFDAALRFDDLDPAVAASLTTLRESFLVELAAQNSNLERITREQDLVRMTESSRRRAGRGRDAAPREPSDPMRQATAARSDLEARYLAQLEALLTADQLARLPAEALARDGGDQPRRQGSSEEARRRVRERFDTNGDGKLDDLEMEKARESMRNPEGGRAPGPNPDGGG